jgi:predicted dehydrogenase
MTVEELDEMEAACKNAGVLFTDHQNRRWDKDMLIAKEAYDKGLLGNLFTIESKLHSGNGYMHEWHLYKKYGGGMIYDWGVHLIDQILFMMPGVKIKSIFADIKNVLHEEVDDYFKIIMKMDNGITVHIELSTYILQYQPRWLVAGDKGTMIVQSFDCDGNIYRTGKLMDKLPPQITETVAGPTRQFAPVAPGGIVTEPLPKVESDWTEFYKNFANVLEGTGELKIKIPEVRRVLAVMEAARKSAEMDAAVVGEL